jgi:hypothetical protein
VKLYAGYMRAKRHTIDGTDERIAPMACAKATKQEAIDHLLELVRKRLPVADGWSEHDADVVEVSDRLLGETRSFEDRMHDIIGKMTDSINKAKARGS